MTKLPRILLLLGLALAGPGWQTNVPDDAPAALAVIVNRKNPTTNLTSAELRSTMRLERQFWPSKERVECLLRPSTSKEMAVLLSKVYRMSALGQGRLLRFRLRRGIIELGAWAVSGSESACGSGAVPDQRHSICYFLSSQRLLSGGRRHRRLSHRWRSRTVAAGCGSVISRVGGSPGRWGSKCRNDGALTR